MTAWISKLRKNLSTLSPALVFSIGLIFLAIGFAGTKIQPSSTFCTVDELTWISCTRNWLNAFGNIFVVIVAIVAARFAFRQWKVAENQAGIALMPNLEERLSRIHEAYELSERAKVLLSKLSHDVSMLFGKAYGDMDLTVIINTVRFINNGLMDIRKHRTAISKYAEDIRTDDDISECLLVVQGKLIFSLNSDVRAVTSYIPHFLSLDTGTRMAMSAIVDLKANRDQLGRCAAALSKAADDIVDVKIELQQLALKVKTRKLQIMDLNVR